MKEFCITPPVRYGYNDWIHFHCWSTIPVDQSECMNYQDSAGYSPAGYGFSAYRSTQLSTGIYYSTWQCWGSCE